MVLEAPSRAQAGPASFAPQPPTLRMGLFGARRRCKAAPPRSVLALFRYLAVASTLQSADDVSFGGSPLTQADSTGEGLKVSTRRDLIGASTPVRGLRPIRSRLARTEKRPKDRSLTHSPRT